MQGFFEFFAMMLGSGLEGLVLIPALLAGCFLKRWAYVCSVGAILALIPLIMDAQLMSQGESVPDNLMLAKVIGPIFVAVVSYLIVQALRRSRSNARINDERNPG